MAQAILNLSDHYQKDLQQTPWDTKDALAAQIAYYFPLNYIRNCRVYDEAAALGFPNDAPYSLDFGVGLGPSRLAEQESSFDSTSSSYVMERSPHALEWLHFLSEENPKTNWLPAWAPQTRGVFSYSLNELTNPPPWFFKLKELIILEPSTHQKSRQLMSLRQRLIENGYHIWAPCTHQLACPLLTQSEKDWCHDRVHWESPEWFRKIENLLPIKNRTLTYSYLLASRTPRPVVAGEGRIVGDDLLEKGKTRWLYCQNPEREFLAWMHKWGAIPDLHRGERISLDDFEKKSNEIRFKEFTRL